LKKLYSVQYLRAIAALMVVHCHAVDLQMLFGTSFQQKFFYLENFGAIGVDIFFVISGFIISFISRSENGTTAAKDFMLRRWIRVAPAYYVASAILFCVFLLSAHYQIKAPDIIKTFTILPIFDYGKYFWSPILVIGWTLSFEFLFYILSAILIAFAVRRRDIFLILIITVLFLLGLFIHNDIKQWNFVTSPMVLEFAFGVMIAMVYKSKMHIPAALSLALLFTGIVSFLCLIIFGYGEVSEVLFVWANKGVELRILLWGLPCLALSAGIILLEKNKPEWIGKNKLLLLLGDASYSIYLVHTICYALLGSTYKRVPFLGSLPGDFLILMSACLATGSGVLFHLFVEKPLIKKLNHLLLKTKTSAVAEPAAK
jgi:peptidoglycan/LPS O-acetylase OafA/YrhL